MLVIAYPYIPGSQSSAFKGISIFLGVLFSLGSSSAIANLIAGVSLTYMRSFQGWGCIKVGDSTGVVLNAASTSRALGPLRTKTFTIPNGSSSPARHQFQPGGQEGDGLILHTSVTIGYDAPGRRSTPCSSRRRNRIHTYPQESAALRTANRAQRFLRGLRGERLYRCPEIMPWIYGELHRNIQNTFNEGGVEIMCLITPDPRRQPHHHPGRLSAADYDAPAIRINMEGKEKKSEA